MIKSVNIDNPKWLPINIKNDPQCLVEWIHTLRDQKRIPFKWHNGDNTTSTMIMVIIIEKLLGQIRNKHIPY